MTPPAAETPDGSDTPSDLVETLKSVALDIGRESFNFPIGQWVNAVDDAVDRIEFLERELAAAQKERDEEREAGFQTSAELERTRTELSAERARGDAMREALIRYNDNTRSFFQIANRIATELGTHALQTNFGGFAETTAKLLKDTHELTNAARAALAARSAAARPADWEPIESAPKTGEHILASVQGGTGFGWIQGKHQAWTCVVHWFNDGFYASTFGCDQPTPFADLTHWKPL